MRALLTRITVLLAVVMSATAVCVVASAPPATALHPTGPRIAAGANFSLMLGTGGTVYAFGQNQAGQLGVASDGAAHPTLTVVPGAGQSLAVAAGFDWSVLLHGDGTVWTFGNNSNGQLGRLPLSAASPTPTKVEGLDRVTAIAAGQFHTLALRSDGSVWGFGANGSGQLGNSIPVGAVSSTPMPIPGLSSILAIAAGADHSLALRSDGTVWAFGDNFFGQLGNPTNNGVAAVAGNPTPTQIPDFRGVSAISGGTDFSVALKADGTVWGFGANNFGQLGRDANATANPIPNAVPGLTSVIAVAAGGGHTLVVRGADRDVLAFGRNDWSQLGAPVNVTPNSIPLLAGVAGATAIAAGGEHSLAVDAVNAVMSFGRNGWGQLGRAANALPNLADRAGTISSFVADAAPVGSLVPARLLDTRPGASTIDGDGAGGDVRTAGSVTVVPVTGRAGVPVDATTATLNVTVTGAQGTGYVTAYPCGAAQPNASNLNYEVGSTIANTAFVKVGVGGAVCLFTSAPAQLIADVTGYYRDTPYFTSIVPARLVDTRPTGTTVDGRSARGGVRANNSTTEFPVRGRAGVPNFATSVVLNITATEAKGEGFITAYPCVPRPNASNVNYTVGATIANAVVIPLAGLDTMCFYTSEATHLIVDIAGWRIDGVESDAVNPARLLDTRPGAITDDGIGAGIGMRPAESTTEVPLLGRGGIFGVPATVILNVTVTQPEGEAFVTVYPCGSLRPNASNLNYSPGETIANLVIAKVGDGDKVCFYTLGATHLIVDLNAFYTL